MVHDLLEQVPLHVEDYPSPQVMAELGVEYRDELCGLYTGIPLDRAEHHPFGPFARRGDDLSRGDRGDGGRQPGPGAPKRLRSQIRITILHELAHYHGMTEKDFERLGYQ